MKLICLSDNLVPATERWKEYKHMLMLMQAPSNIRFSLYLAERLFPLRAVEKEHSSDIRKCNGGYQSHESGSDTKQRDNRQSFRVLQSAKAPVLANVLSFGRCFLVGQILKIKGGLA